MICSGEEFGKPTFNFYLKKYDSSDGFKGRDFPIERVCEYIHNECLERNGFQYLRKDFLASLSYLTRLG